MKILIASDHAGFALKQSLTPFLIEMGYEVEDKGNTVLDENDDYPDFIAQVAREVSSNFGLKGIVIGGSGQGEAIVANRFPHVRAVVFNGQYKSSDGRKIPEEIILSRQHNDANVLSLGARFLNDEEAKEAVKLWLETEFSNDERHVRRIRKIDELK